VAVAAVASSRLGVVIGLLSAGGGCSARCPYASDGVCTREDEVSEPVDGTVLVEVTVEDGCGEQRAFPDGCAFEADVATLLDGVGGHDPGWVYFGLGRDGPVISELQVADIVFEEPGEVAAEIAAPSSRILSWFDGDFCWPSCSLAGWTGTITAKGELRVADDTGDRDGLVGQLELHFDGVTWEDGSTLDGVTLTALYE
jgi:hypothetical protein